MWWLCGCRVAPAFTGTPPIRIHYVRLQPPAGTDDLLIVGGEDHKVGQHEQEPAASHNHLEAWARPHFDGLGEVAFAWSGQVLESVDA